MTMVPPHHAVDRTAHPRTTPRSRPPAAPACAAPGQRPPVTAVRIKRRPPTAQPRRDSRTRPRVMLAGRRGLRPAPGSPGCAPLPAPSQPGPVLSPEQQPPSAAAAHAANRPAPSPPPPSPLPERPLKTCRSPGRKRARQSSTPADPGAAVGLPRPPRARTLRQPLNPNEPRRRPGTRAATTSFPASSAGRVSARSSPVSA